MVISFHLIVLQEYLYKRQPKNLALSIISGYLDLKQKVVLYKGTIRSKFSNCPLVSMFFSKKLNNLTNKVHEISFRIVNGDNHIIFENLPKNCQAITIPQKNLMSEMS